ncbi:hypothetical protein L2E82_52905 [Cichorium intybus]|nr:hypothetical protein L2E82_52905 [Cichorium intybus]
MGGGAWPFLGWWSDLSGHGRFEGNNRPGKSLKFHRDGDRSLQLLVFNEEFPSKRESSARVDYVPALCTHRPSLLPIEWSGEVLGSRRRGRFAAGDVARIPLNLII